MRRGSIGAVLFGIPQMGPGRGMMTGSRQRGKHMNRKSAHGSVLCWVPRLLSLPVGLYLAWASVDLLVAGYEWSHQWVLIPLALLIIGWWWHPAGSTGLGLLGVFYLGCGLWGLAWEGWSDTVIQNIVIAALLLAGGVLHLVAWCKEKQGKRAST
jgi:hypothetical protein